MENLDDFDLLPKIGKLREEKKLTQLELSRMVGVTETTIANWEKGRRGLDWFDRLIRLCAALECKPEDLVAYAPRSEEDSEMQEELLFSDFISLLNSKQKSQVSSLQAWVEHLKEKENEEKSHKL